MTEDYSSYESVDDDEEPEPAMPAKRKDRAKPPAKSKEREDDSSTSSTPKVQPTVKPEGTQPSKGARSGKLGSGMSKSTQQKQKSLAMFFTAPTKGKN